MSHSSLKELFEQLDGATQQTILAEVDVWFQDCMRDLRAQHGDQTKQPCESIEWGIAQLKKVIEFWEARKPKLPEHLSRDAPLPEFNITDLFKIKACMLQIDKLATQVCDFEQIIAELQADQDTDPE